MLNFALNFTKETIDEKFKNPFWKNFIIVWLTWNWKVWYITFFISENIVGNKFNYIINSYECYGYSFLGIILNWFIAPILGSYILVWFFPYLSNLFLEKHQKNKEKENKIIKKEIESENKKDSAIIEKLKIENKKIQEKNKKIELLNIETNSEHKVWDIEYNKIIKKDNQILKKLSGLIYEMYGFTYILKDRQWTKFNPKDEQILNSLDLIEKTNEIGDDRKKGNSYIITEKGKYFLKKSTLE